MIKKLLVSLLTVLMLVGLVACKKDDNLEAQALARYKELMAEENEILGKDTELWEKVYMASDKMSMIEDGKNYGDFLLDMVEIIKDELSEDDYGYIKNQAQKIKDIETELTELENKYPDLSAKANDSSMNMEEMEAYPSFTGKDLDGNDVDSKEVFKNNKFTVVNYWFTGCTGCVAELADLEKLNKEYKEMGGELVGVNTTLLDGKEEDIKEAKDLLAAKGVTYRNFYFAKDSAAGKFTENIFAYPITYVIDSQGNIVGEPILGALMEDAQKELLDKYIQEALSK